MKLSPGADERTAAGLENFPNAAQIAQLPAELGTADPHAKEDLSAGVIDALYPTGYPELEDPAQDEALSRQDAGPRKHHRLVAVPGEALAGQAPSSPVLQGKP